MKWNWFESLRRKARLEIKVKRGSDLEEKNCGMNFQQQIQFYICIYLLVIRNRSNK